MPSLITPLSELQDINQIAKEGTKIMSHILGQVKRVMWGVGDSPVIWGVPVMVSDLTVYCQRSLRKAGVTSETVTLFDIVDWNNVNKLAIKQKKLKQKMGHREFIQCFINIVFCECNNHPEMKAL